MDFINSLSVQKIEVLLAFFDHGKYLNSPGTLSVLFAIPNLSFTQIFYSFFKTLVGKAVCVELKNDLSLTGTLESVDQYLNVKLTNVEVVDKERFPQLVSVKSCFVRGSTIRYIQIPRDEVDTELLQDAARKEAQQI